jgi:signal transduction histidine kinase
MSQGEQMDSKRVDFNYEWVSYEEVFHLCPYACVVTDLNCLIQKVNLAGLRLFGQKRDFLARMPFLQFVPLSDRHAVFTLISDLRKQGKPEPENLNIILLPPRMCPVPCSISVAVIKNLLGATAKLCWLIRENNDARNGAQSFGEVKKKEALGHFVQTMAQDFNNILAGIMIHAEAAGLSDLGEERQQSLEEIQAGCKRAANLVRQLSALTSDGNSDGAPQTNGHLFGRTLSKIA